MLLTELLTPQRIRIPIEARDKRGVLGELVSVLAAGNGADPASLLAAVEEREAMLSTGIGAGVAIPHGKSSQLTELKLAAGVSPHPIPFEARDGEPVRLFFLLIGPVREAAQQVKALSRIARLVRHAELRDGLINATDPEAFLRVLRAADVR